MTLSTRMAFVLPLALVGCAGGGPDSSTPSASDPMVQTACVGKCDGAVRTDDRVALRAAPAGCNAEVEYVKSTYNLLTEETTIELSVTSDRPLNDILRSLDPQSWDVCSPHYFKSTYLTDRDENPIPDPPAPGSSWEGLLYEDVAFPVLGHTVSEIHNFLGFTSEAYDPPRDGVVHHFDYWIDTNLDVEVLGHAFTPGLDIDDGWIDVSKAEDGRWRVTGLKKIHFTLAPGLTALTNASSPLLFQKVLGDLGVDLACCPNP
jgi:hypothetical protein